MKDEYVSVEHLMIALFNKANEKLMNYLNYLM